MACVDQAAPRHDSRLTTMSLHTISVIAAVDILRTESRRAYSTRCSRSIRSMSLFSTILGLMVLIFIVMVVLASIVVAISAMQRVFGESIRAAVLLFVVAVAGIGWSVYRVVRWEIDGRKMTAEQQTPPQTDYPQTRQAIAQFLSSTNSIDDWKNNVCRPEQVAPLLSPELQTALLRQNARPVLLTGLLEDMRQEKDESVLTLSSQLACGGITVRSDLTLEPNQTQIILAHRNEFLQYYAVAARIASVEKVNGSVFLVRGECAGLLFTGQDGLSIDLDESQSKATANSR
jgi:hypothetical protein